MLEDFYSFVYFRKRIFLPVFFLLLFCLLKRCDVREIKLEDENPILVATLFTYRTFKIPHRTNLQKKKNK